MPALVTGIHVLRWVMSKNVDSRDKPAMTINEWMR
jgi:hypothetical protein